MPQVNDSSWFLFSFILFAVVMFFMITVHLFFSQNISFFRIDTPISFFVTI